MTRTDTSYSTWTCDRCGVTEQTDASHHPPHEWRIIVIEVIGLARSLTDYRPQPTYCGSCADEVRDFIAPDKQPKGAG
jgi:hypothetical protein